VAFLPLGRFGLASAFWIHSAYLHEYTLLCTYMHVLSDLCMILPKPSAIQGLSQSVQFGQSFSITETFFASSKRWRI